MSVTFSMVRSGDVTAYTRDDFEPHLTELCGFLCRAIELDWAEFEYAKSKMKGFLFFWDGYDAEGTQSKFTQLEKDACAAMREGIGNEHAKGLPHSNGDGGRFESLLKTVYYVVPNMTDPHKQWGSHADRLHEMGERARAIVIDSWQGQSAEAYRRKAAERANDAFFLEDVARCNQWAIEATSFLQSMIAEKMMTALKKAQDAASREECAIPVRTGIIDSRAEGWNDSGIISFNFYERTVAVWDAIAGLPNVWLALLNEDLDWQTSARKIRDTLKKAIEAMEQRHADAGYVDGLGLIDKDNGVDDQETHADVHEGDQNMEDSIF